MWKIAVSALMSISSATAPSVDVASLQWLSGAWVQEDCEGWTEENWSAPRGGTMLGTSFGGKGDKVAVFEFMRIVRNEDGTVIFWASPGGKAPVPFHMIASSDGEATFENPANDYPTRISYRRSGEELIATIAGPGGGNAQSWRYKRR